MSIASGFTRRGIAARSTAASFHWRLPTIALLALLAGGCGGGSSGNSAASSTATSGGSTPSTPSGTPAADNVSMSVSPTSLSVTATLQVSFSGIAVGQEIYFQGSYSTRGIQTATGASAGSITVSVQFKTPGSLGVGTYDDTLQLEGCYDQACTQPVTNSPISVAVQYTVTATAIDLSSINPASVPVGSPAFTLTVMGSGFSSSAQVLLNGSARQTTVVSATELIAAVQAADVASLGSAAISVQDPNSSTGTTPAQTLTIAPASIDAVAFQIDPAHSGSVNFNSIVLPSSAAWSVDVGGTPSYAVIAGGNVYVAVNLGSGGSEVIALSQTTGATVWGPILIGGSANVAYDDGKLFVLSAPFANAATMEAFDAQSGASLWSTLLSGQYGFSAALTAADGYVYTGGAGSGGTLYAVDETNGNIAWTQPVQNGDNSAPAVTLDGVYVTYPCWTYDFRPATGDSIWNQNTGCEGGGGATPVVANQLVYSPNEASGYDGSIYAAETGASGGTYSADAPPAVTATSGYFLQGGTLRGVSLADNTVQWSFAGDGHLTGAPLAVGQYVFIGSAAGNLFGVDATSGQQVWQMTLPAPLAWSTNDEFSGLSAGDGLLVVPAGTKVTAYLLSNNP